jgi:hypothetical protein
MVCKESFKVSRKTWWRIIMGAYKVLRWDENRSKIIVETDELENLK